MHASSASIYFKYSFNATDFYVTCIWNSLLVINVNDTLNAAIFYTFGAAMLSYFKNIFNPAQIKVLVNGVF